MEELTEKQRNAKLRSLSHSLNEEGVTFLIQAIEQRRTMAMATTVTSNDLDSIKKAQGEYGLAQSLLSLVDEAKEFSRDTP